MRQALRAVVLLASFDGGLDRIVVAKPGPGYAIYQRSREMLIVGLPKYDRLNGLSMA
jgi:hypothetical protein